MLLSIISLFTNKKAKDNARKKKQQQHSLATFTSFVNAAAKGVSSSTRKNYETAVRSFNRFNKGKHIPLTRLSGDHIRLYERWLRENNVSLNTSSCYLRSLRAIYNKAVARRKVKDAKPFANAFTSNDKTAKRCLTENDIRKIKTMDADSLKPKEKFTRDLFLFSFYAMGMPFVDILNFRLICSDNASRKANYL